MVQENDTYCYVDTRTYLNLKDEIVQKRLQLTSFLLQLKTVTIDANIVFYDVQHITLNLRKFCLGFHDPLNVRVRKSFRLKKIPELVSNANHSIEIRENFY